VKIAVCFMGEDSRAHARHIAQLLQEHTQATEVCVYNRPAFPTVACKELVAWRPDVTVYVDARRGGEDGM
jgi:hypothetical protein